MQSVIQVRDVWDWANREVVSGTFCVCGFELAFYYQCSMRSDRWAKSLVLVVLLRSQQSNLSAIQTMP